MQAQYFRIVNDFELVKACTIFQLSRFHSFSFALVYTYLSVEWQSAGLLIFISIDYAIFLLKECETSSCMVNVGGFEEEKELL